MKINFVCRKCEMKFRILEGNVWSINLKVFEN